MQICIKNAKHYKYTATVDTSKTILHKTSYSANDYQTKWANDMSHLSQRNVILHSSDGLHLTMLGMFVINLQYLMQ